jgi:ferredoxin
MRKKKTKKPKDAFLDDRIASYDEWLRKDLIEVSSKVVPVHESLKAEQWVLPREQALEILRKSTSFALTECQCRSHYQRCKNPLDVCLMLNDAADRYVDEGLAKRISIKEAEAVLSQANARGLVHLTLYEPDHKIYALCSCCSCCCHDLQLLKSYGRKDLVARSEYIALTDPEKCTDCGQCIGRCVFEARARDKGTLNITLEKCYGCGLCVTSCPADAILLERKQ